MAPRRVFQVMTAIGLALILADRFDLVPMVLMWAGVWLSTAGLLGWAMNPPAARNYLVSRNVASDTASSGSSESQGASSLPVATSDT